VRPDMEIDGLHWLMMSELESIAVIEDVLLDA
jgi:hypothetical protein